MENVNFIANLSSPLMLHILMEIVYSLARNSMRMETFLCHVGI